MKRLFFVWIVILCVALGGGCGGSGGGGTVAPVPSSGPTPIVTPNPSGVPTPSVTPGVTINPTPGISPDITPGVTPGVSPDITPTVTATPTPAFSVNVKDYGAKGDGATDDTAAIQKAIDAVAGEQGEVIVPDGTYMINARTSTAFYAHGLMLSNDMTLRLSSKAVLKAFPTSSEMYSVVLICRVSNVNVIGGTIEGERSGYISPPAPIPGDEQGMGLAIFDSKNILVDGVTAKECWGDGFLVSTLNKKLAANGCVNVTLQNVIADHNRRQGLSVIFADGLVVRNSVFRNTEGVPPEAGIDLEPELGVNVETVKNVSISGCTFEGNAGHGLLLCLTAPSGGKASYIQNVKVEKNVFRNNGGTKLPNKLPGCGMYVHGYRSSDGSTQINISDVSLIDNTIEQSKASGVECLYTERFKMAGNTVRGNASAGVLQTRCLQSNISSNTLSNNGGNGVHLSDCTKPAVVNNTIANNKGYGVRAARCVDTGGILGNTCSGNAAGDILITQ